MKTAIERIKSKTKKKKKEVRVYVKKVCIAWVHTNNQLQTYQNTTASLRFMFFCWYWVCNFY